MRKLIWVIALALIPQIVKAQGFTVSGYLKDAENGEVLIGASVVVSGTSQGAVSNVYGFYSLTLPPDNYTLDIRYIGYNSSRIEVDLVSGNQRVDIELIPESQQLEEVVVSATAEDENVTRIQMSVNSLEAKTIKSMPAFLGEADVIKSIQMLPGVSTVGEGASGFNARGGSVGQNMVLLDEAPVYNSSHMLGFFSVFNPDAVKDITLMKGGIPARYGGRISSVLDIRMKEGNSKAFEAEGGIGTIFSRLSVQGPLAKNKASFIVAGRRSYIDVLAKPFTDVLDDGAQLYFYDLTMKANWNVNPNNRVFVSSYIGNDVFMFDAQQGFRWGNRTTTVRWNHIFGERLFSNFTWFFSDYRYKLAFGTDPEDQFDWNSRVKNIDLKPEFSYFINPQNELSFGGEVSYLNFEPANAVGVSNGEARDISIDEKYALESAAYVDNSQKIGGNLELRYGIRFSAFSLIGPGRSYSFGDTIPGERRPVIGVREYEDREIIASYFNPEPRIAVKYQLDRRNSIKASYDRTYQYMHLISNTTASNPLDVWTPSSKNLMPQDGHQTAVGWFRNFGPDNNIEFSVETYYRLTNNQVDYIDGAEILINELLEGDLLSGKGRAYGMEALAKKVKGQFTGWVSYTLARTELKVDGINKGEWYPTRYDQTHNLKVAGFYDTENKWLFSANFTFISGTPTTFPTSRYEVQGMVRPHNYNGSRNSIRIPSYHRLDVSATMKLGKNQKTAGGRKFESNLVFSIYNLYAHKNPFSIYFTQDQPSVIGLPTDAIITNARQVSIIGTMIPAISYNFKF